jgi:hypothetical protein
MTKEDFLSGKTFEIHFITYKYEKSYNQGIICRYNGDYFANVDRVTDTYAVVYSMFFFKVVRIRLVFENCKLSDVKLTTI